MFWEYLPSYSIRAEKIIWLNGLGATISDHREIFHELLHIAAQTGRVAILVLLQEMGLVLQDVRGREDMIYAAAAYGHAGVLDWLWQMGVKFNKRKLRWILGEAADRNHVNVLRWLERFISVADCRFGGNLPLRLAADRGHKEALDWLRNRGMTLEDCRKSLKELLINAAKQKRHKTLQWLREMGVTAEHCRAANDGSILIEISKCNHMGTLRWFQDLGICAEDCRPVLQKMVSLAKKKGRAETLRWLQEMGLSVS